MSRKSDFQIKEHKMFIRFFRHLQMKHVQAHKQEKMWYSLVFGRWNNINFKYNFLLMCFFLRQVTRRSPAATEIKFCCWRFSMKRIFDIRFHFCSLSMHQHIAEHKTIAFNLVPFLSQPSFIRLLLPLLFTCCSWCRWCILKFNSHRYRLLSSTSQKKFLMTFKKGDKRRLTGRLRGICSLNFTVCTSRVLVVFHSVRWRREVNLCVPSLGRSEMSKELKLL